LRCTIGDTVSERTVKVEKYVLPKFKLELALQKPFYKPGEKVTGTLKAKYLFGQPVANGEVKLEARSTDVSSNAFMQQTLKTDSEGNLNFEFDLPPQLFGQPQNGGAAKVQLYATVTDAAGQVYTTMASRLVTRDPLKIELIADGGMLVQKQPNKIYIHVSYADGKPAVAEVTLNKEQPTKTNDLGIAVIEVTPQDPIFGITVAADDGQGNRTAFSQQLACSTIANDFVLQPDRAVYDGGATMKLTAQGGGVEPVFVDLIKDGQTMLSQTIDVKDGSGTLEVDLPPDLFGSVELVAYRFDNSGLATRKSRLIFIHQAKELKIAATLDKDEYRPGTKAKIKFTLTDGDGKPTAGAISLAAVDEAVFALLNQRPGLEQAFFLAEKELLQPIYRIYPDWSPNPGPQSSEPDRQLLEDAVFALTAHTAVNEINLQTDFRNNVKRRQGNVFEDVMPLDSPPMPVPPAVGGEGPVFARAPITLVANSFPIKDARIEQQREHGLRGVTIAWFALFAATFVFGVISFAVLQPKVFMITAGVLFVLALCGTPIIGGGLLLMMGGKSAPMAKMEAMVGMAPRAAMDMEFAGAEGMPQAEAFEPPLPAPEEGPPPAAPTAPPRVRQHFPETLFWQPELVTNDAGEAELPLDLADSITTWRLSASAVSGAGQLGSAEVPIKVFQPFFVDLNLPVALTRNDEVSVPVVAYNYLDKPQTVKLDLDVRDWFELLGGEASLTLDLKPGEVRSLHYRLRVKDVGYQQLKVTATGGGVADAIERGIDVVPNGVLIEVAKSGSLETPGAPVTMDVSIPENVVTGSVKGFVKFHPGGFSQLVEGLDAIFRMPGGCFEQTSSSTYPNVLALDYLRSTKKAQPQIEAKARQYIHTGYQRLISFEVGGGGFDWFGNPPANKTLTAYGLMEFVDMAKVHDVDPRLIERTRNWLLTQRKPDGTWEPEPHMLNDGLAGSVNRGADPRLAATAYIAWSVFHSAPADKRSSIHQQNFRLTATYLLSHKPESINDPYILATVAMALAAFDPKLPELDRYLAHLDSLKKDDGKLCWWEQPGGAPRPFYGNGDAGQIETTAMATLAMLTAKARPATTSKALAWLVVKKDPHGTWYSTQATVLALKALLGGTNVDAAPKERKFEVKVNGQLVQELTIPADQSDVVKQLDLSARLTKVGEANSISIAETTDTATSFQAVFRHYLDQPAEPKPQEPLSITINYDRERLTVDESVTATATVINNMAETAPMVILDLPIPGGFTLERGELDELVGSKTIEKYQLTPRQAIVYLRGLTPGQKLDLRYRLRATMPVKVTVPKGEAYEYYNPAKRGASEAKQLEATIKT
jgi:hypothetical protein